MFSAAPRYRHPEAMGRMANALTGAKEFVATQPPGLVSQGYQVITF